MKTRIVRSLLLLLVTLGLMPVVPATSALAQVSFGVSPSILQVAGTPGTTGEQDLQVVNNSEIVTPVVVTVQDFSGIDPVHSAVDWVSVETSTMDLVPGVPAAVTVSLHIPDDAPTGGAYAQLSIRSVQEEGANLSLDAELLVGILFEVDGDGDLRREIDLTEIGPVLEMDGRVSVRASVANTGNTVAYVTGETQLVSVGDEDVSASLVLPRTRILPSLSGEITSEGTLPLPAQSSWTARTTIYPGDPAETDDLESVEVELNFTVNPVLSASATICENLGGGPTVNLTMSNDGTIGLTPVVNVGLTTIDGNLVAGAASQDATVAWPGQATSIAIEGLPQLGGGDYVLTITALLAEGLDPIVTEVPFSIGGFGENVAPLCGTDPAATPDE